MAAGGATEDRFRARAGALTLLFVAGSIDRDRLLEMLEQSLDGRLLPVPDEDDLLDDVEPVAELEADEEELEGSPVGPDPTLRITPKGEEFLFVAGSIERWLRNSPHGPMALGPRCAGALVPLVASWSAMITHALAAGPLTADELTRAVGNLDHETVVAHLEPMERSGQVEPTVGDDENRYRLTRWGREAITPIVAAARYEMRYPESDVMPPDVFDVEAAFQMALPLVMLPPDLRGSCRLGAELDGEEPVVAGATVEVDRGCVVSSSALLDQEPETWVSGSPLDWCEDVVDPEAGCLRTGGDTDLARGLVRALHERLFGDPTD